MALFHLGFQPNIAQTAAEVNSVNLATAKPLCKRYIQALLRPFPNPFNIP